MPGDVSRRDEAGCSSTQKQNFPEGRRSVNIPECNESSEKLTKERLCSAGCQHRRACYQNVSKQQIKPNYVCFPGLCLCRGLSLASAVGIWQRTELSSS